MTKIPAPSPRTKPSRVRSNGRLAVFGESQRCERAVSRLKPVTPSGWIMLWLPPAHMMSASPKRMISIASPIACELAAQAVWRIEGSPKNALPVLLESLKSPEDHVRADAAFCLGLMGPDAKGAAEPMRAALKDPFNKVRFWVAYGLVRADRNDPAKAVLLEAVQKAGLPQVYSATRIEVLRVLGELALKDKAAVPVLRQALDFEPHHRGSDRFGDARDRLRIRVKQHRVARCP